VRVSEKAPEVLAKRGYSPEMVSLARRLFTGQMAPKEVFPILMKLGPAYFYHLSPLQVVQLLVQGVRSKIRPAAPIFWYGKYVRGWTVMDRLGQIQVPTLVLAGRHDFVFPPECQEALAAAIPNARLVIIDRAGHNPMDERPTETLQAVRSFFKESR
jgi:pimeloyl-ACP methyl ester carboxylesterase